MHNPDDLNEQGWENFQADPNQPVPTQKMREHIESRVGKPPGTTGSRTSGRMRTMAWVAAASVILLAGIAGLHYGRTGAREKPVAAAQRHSLPARIVAKQTIINSTSETQSFFLPDGSKVRLTTGSSLAFDSLFAGPRRGIALTGEAVFTVARNPSKPFIVYSKDIAVTALGTVFGVDDTHGGFTSVLLYSGRVVVKKADFADPAGTASRSFADVYLSPGQQLTVNRADLSVRIRMALQPKSITPSDSSCRRLPPQQMMSFTRQPLAEIFEALHNAYHITIAYNRAGVENMDFTGTFNSEKETLESFLSTLCSLNDLTLKKTKGGFSIQAK
jgi:transmembrane sensor